MNARLRKGGRVQRALIATALGVALGAGLLTWTRVEILRAEYRLTQLVERQSELRAEVEKLAVEVAVLRTPERIERRAVALGLQYPEPGQIAGPLLVTTVADAEAAPGGNPR